MLLKLEEDGVVIGWANAEGQDSIDLKAQGYVESSEEERQKIIESKKRKIDKPIVESVTIAPQQEAVRRKPGRKPKNFGVNSNGNSPDFSKS